MMLFSQKLWHIASNLLLITILYPNLLLPQEMEVINKIKEKLQQKIDESFEQMCLLQEARQQVLLDLQDKNIALGIDIDQYNLTENSPGISYKPNPTRVPKG